MSAQPEALRWADVLVRDVGNQLVNRKQAAAELRRLHAEVLEQCRLNGMGSEREAKLMAENEANERNLCQLTDELAKTVALLRQALEALETDDWQKKLMAAIDIKRHLENGS